MEWIGVPGLTINWHHVGMAGEHDASPIARAKGGVEIRFLAGFVVDEPAFHAEAIQVIADEIDQLENGFAAGRVEGDQPLDHVEALSLGCFRVHERSPLLSYLEPRWCRAQGLTSKDKLPRCVVL